MTNKQQQSTAVDSLAIQSGRDTNIGLSGSEVRAIVEAVGDQIPKFTAIAGALIDERLRVFEEKIVERFTEDKKAKPEVFADPDFLFQVRQAQVSFARSGEEGLGESLADLIAERSQAEGKTRLALTLNGAVERVSYLTKEELAELALAFVVRRVNFGATDAQSLGIVVNSYFLPFLENISHGESSYSYLESLGCGKLSFGEIDLGSALTQSYPFLIQTVDRVAVDAAADHDRTQQLIDAGLIRLEEDNRLRRVFNTVEEFRAAAMASGFDLDSVEATWTALQGQPMSRQQIIDLLLPFTPSITEVFETWDGTLMKKFELSATGLAIGYSVVKRVKSFDAAISIWIN